MTEGSSEMHVLNMHSQVISKGPSFSTNRTTISTSRVGDNILIELLVSTCKDKFLNYILAFLHTRMT